MAVFKEGMHAAEAILSEANFSRSRDNGVIKKGSGTVEANTVLAVGDDGKYAPAKAADTAVAMNIHRVDSKDDDVQVALITRDAELNKHCLTFASDVNDASKIKEKLKQLADVGIIAR